MSARTPEAEPLLTPAEVATMFRVDPKTVTRWAKAGKLTSIRTLGGHRRYRRPRSVHCSRVFRSSVPSSIPPWEHGREDGALSMPSTMLMGGARPEGCGVSPSGRGQLARVILTGS